MNFTEFERMLGTEPRNGDPEFLQARHSSPEFEKAAEDSDRFESRLQLAVTVPVPESLYEDILAITKHAQKIQAPQRKWPLALAASLLIGVGAAGLGWKMSNSWDSVEDYVVDHYRHDGLKMISRTPDSTADDVQAVLAKLDVEAAPSFADIVGVIKYCPTPDGKGVHMVLNTQSGPVTVIYMPETAVADRATLDFDGVEAILVDLQVGSAAVIGSGEQEVSSLYAMVQGSIFPSISRS
jgi:hypothetical protein